MSCRVEWDGKHEITCRVVWGGMGSLSEQVGHADERLQVGHRSPGGGYGPLRTPWLMASLPSVVYTSSIAFAVLPQQVSS